MIRLPDRGGVDRRALGRRRRGRPARGPRAAGRPDGSRRPRRGPASPCPAEGVPDDLVFFEELRVLMQAFPPADRDRAYQPRFAPLGLLDPESPYAMPGPALHEALEDGLAGGRAVLEAALRRRRGRPAERVAADVPRLRLQPGLLRGGRARRRPVEAAGRPRAATCTRAAAARGGLWGNHGYEAAYAMVYVDGAGEPLDGARRYELRFADAAAVRGVLVGDDVRRARTSSWSRTRSTATRSATAPAACTPPTTAR